MSARLLSIGCATPPGRLTLDLSIEFASRFAHAGVSESMLNTLHRRTGIRERGTMLLDSEGNASELYAMTNEPPNPTTAARLALYTEHAATLGFAASHQALDRAGVTADRVTHLITASCTGFSAPGVDQHLIHRLSLPRSVRRTHIGFMGCHAAINSLAIADAIAKSDSAAVVLVCCMELSTLHMHCTERADQLIANALFADGAAAAVVSRSADSSLPELSTFASAIFDDTAADMTWNVGDHGFEMTLAASVPDTLKVAVPPWVDATLDSASFRRSDVSGWAIHPGGPRIVRSIGAGLDLPEESLRDSLAILEAHGNMSSPTVLFILHRLWDQGTPRPWMAMAFGPGLAAEGCVLR